MSISEQAVNVSAFYLFANMFLLHNYQMKFDEVWVIFALFNDLLLHKLRIPEMENYCEQL